jgi:hypothetical protein
MKARLRFRGVVAHLAKATSLGCGPRLATEANPSLSFVPKPLGCGTRSHHLKAIMLGLLLGLAALGAQAQATPWSTLTPAQQRVLMPFADQWEQLDPATQKKLLQGAERWQAMDAQQRQETARRFGEWQRLPPEQRRWVRQRFQDYKRLPAQQQQRMRQNFGRFQKLPPAQRARLRERWEAMSPAERRAFVAGMEASDALQGPPALRHLPPEERAATMRMMESLTPAERQAVRRRMQPLAPEQKEALRRQLLEMSAGQRSEFLRAQQP